MHPTGMHSCSGLKNVMKTNNSSFPERTYEDGKMSQWEVCNTLAFFRL